MPRDLYSSIENPMQIRVANGAKIWYKTAEKPNMLYGRDVRAVVIDEASRMREEAWVAINSVLTATDGACRVIGNVHGNKNWFYTLARFAQAGEPGFSYHKMTAYDAVRAGVIKLEVVQRAKKLLAPHVFNELFLAEASGQDINPFGGPDKIRENVVPLEDCLKRQPVVWGWDLAKSIDWTVGIALDRDGYVCRFERWQRVPWDVTVQRIKDKTRNLRAKVDSSGVGDPIIEQLQKNLGSNFEGFKFTSNSKQQLMEGLVATMHQGRIKYPYDFTPQKHFTNVLVDELELFEFVFTGTGVKYAAPTGAGNHDDAVMALALAVSCYTQYYGKGDLDMWKKLIGR